MSALHTSTIGIVMMTLAATSALGADQTDSRAAATPRFPLGPELQNIPLEDLEQAYDGKTPPEAIRMYLAIQRELPIGPGQGWFGPAQSRYTWDWLAERHGITPDAVIDREMFRGDGAAFARLDRNRDGRIAAEDLDWSDDNPWVEQSYMVNRLFRRIDPDGDGQLTQDEWLKFFESAAQGKDHLTPEDLRDRWLAGIVGGFVAGDEPTKETLLKGLFSGEIGSVHEGPNLNDPAPDFTLKTFDGGKAVHLTEVIGKRPVVLVFGNFTCGPFRSMYPGVEAVAQRFGDAAVFLAVYVREAHPTDGWKMESNAKVGVAVAQPKTDAERCAVAGQCFAKLKPTIPLLVDGIDDATGHAYSAMPARLYVIDTTGRVAYKSGRGPFGFKTGEMEQALVMTLIDR